MFGVWAPNAERVSVVGDFNGWDAGAHPLSPRARSGIWEAFVPGAAIGARYKFHIESRFNGYRVDKADPYGTFHEVPMADSVPAGTGPYAKGCWCNSSRSRVTSG